MPSFKSLPVGASFDFIDDANPSFNSFYSRCVKVSPRCYRASLNTFDAPVTLRVGSINAAVYHVDHWYGCGLKG